MADIYLANTSAPRKSIYIIEDVAVRLKTIQNEHKNEMQVWNNYAWVSLPLGLAMIVVGTLNIYLNDEEEFATTCRVCDWIPVHLVAGGVLCIGTMLMRTLIKVSVGCSLK